jgi:hypothetical protein
MVNYILSTESTARFSRVFAMCLMIGMLTLPLHQSVAQDCSCGAPCYVLLDNDNFYGIEDFIACLTIEVGPNIVVEDSADVTFSAGESIILNSAILINKNATVSLEIDPLLFCDMTVDVDEDLSDACLDCNDDDSAVYPGAAEICDGLDNDCNALTDEMTIDSCDDGLFCTADTCNGVGGCSFIPDNALCDDGAFCSGIETCGIEGCSSGPPPCPGPDGDGNCTESCDELGENCNANDPDSSGCNDGDNCTFGDTCHSGICTGTPIEDEYESNDSRESASNLGSIEDGDAFPVDTATANLYETGDVDWYKFHDSDTPTGSGEPRVDLTSIPSGSDYQLCAYFECDDPGDSPSLDCTQGFTTAYDGLPGCCSSNSGSMSERVSFTMDCDNGVITGDNNGWVYVRVYNASSTWNCSNYSLPWGDD